MKYGILFSLIALFGLAAQQGQNSPSTPENVATMTAKFKVYGNCEMCKKRIEKAAKIDGVSSAEWNVESKMLVITFDEKKARPSKVHDAVAAVGHDTDIVKAKDEVYNKLHGCCQYR